MGVVDAGLCRGPVADDVSYGMMKMQAFADVQLMHLETTVSYSQAQIALHTALENPVREEP